jgi:hypothetical protein
MQEESELENGKLDKIIESLDLLFTRVTDMGVTEQQMRKSVEGNSAAIEKQTQDHRFMAQQLEQHGKAVARLTLNQMRFQEDSSSDTECSLEESVQQSFPPTFQKKKKPHQHKEPQQHNPVSKYHMPKVFCPRFNGDNPVVWKDKCIDYFLLVNLPPEHWVQMAGLHFDDPAAQWLQVYKRHHKNPTWLQFVTAVEHKFGKNDYRKAWMPCWILSRLALSKSTSRNSRNCSSRFVCIMMDMGICFLLHSL